MWEWAADHSYVRTAVYTADVQWYIQWYHRLYIVTTRNYFDTNWIYSQATFCLRWTVIKGIWTCMYTCVQYNDTTWWYIGIVQWQLADIVMDPKRAIRRRKGVKHRPAKYLQSGNSDKGVISQLNTFRMDLAMKVRLLYPYFSLIYFSFGLSIQQNLAMSNPHIRLNDVIILRRVSVNRWIALTKSQSWALMSSVMLAWARCGKNYHGYRFNAGTQVCQSEQIDQYIMNLDMVN